MLEKQFVEKSLASERGCHEKVNNGWLGLFDKGFEAAEGPISLAVCVHAPCIPHRHTTRDLLYLSSQTCRHEVRTAQRHEPRAVTPISVLKEAE